MVFVVKGDQVERRAIGVGERDGDRTRVEAGLSEGERVVIDGAEGLADGDRVREE